MPHQSVFLTTFATPFPQAHFLPVLGTRDDAAHQTRHLGLLGRHTSLCISFVSHTLPSQSPSSKGPKRPSFYPTLFLANAPSPRASIHLIPSSSRSLRSLRFLLPPRGFSTKPVATAGTHVVHSARRKLEYPFCQTNGFFPPIGGCCR